VILAVAVSVSLLHSLGAASDDSQRQAAEPGTVRIAGVVLKWVRADKEANYRRAEPLIREAAAHGAKIVCTTECFLDGYAIADKSIPLETYRALGEPIPQGEYFRRLSALARELKILLIAGMLEADGDARYNAAALVGPDGKLIGKYRKQHLEHEAVRNTAGDESSVFDTPFGRIGVMICADRRLADVVKRFCDQGADFLICPSGGMFGPKNNDPILQARSKENHKYIVFVHPAEFLVTGPDGTILRQTIVGDKLVISPAEVGTGADSSRVFYFDLPQAPKGASPESPRPASAGETAASVPQYRRSILGQAAIYWKLRPSTGSTRILQNRGSEGGTSQCPRA
jgi:predicted amidohydrolase